MEVRVVGVWEQGWNAPWSEHDLWSFPIRDFGVDAWAMTPITGIQKNEGLHEFQTLREPITRAREDGLAVVWVDEGGTLPIQEFWHPDAACYVFGRTSYAPHKEFGQPGEAVVRIPTPANSGLLWAHQAMCIILYDRLRQRWPSP